MYCADEGVDRNASPKKCSINEIDSESSWVSLTD